MLRKAGDEAEQKSATPHLSWWSSLSLKYRPQCVQDDRLEVHLPWSAQYHYSCQSWKSRLWWGLGKQFSWSYRHESGISKQEKSDLLHWIFLGVRLEFYSSIRNSFRRFRGFACLRSAFLWFHWVFLRSFGRDTLVLELPNVSQTPHKSTSSETVHKNRSFQLLVLSSKVLHQTESQIFVKQ